MTIIHISIGGPTRLIVDGKGREWYFEDHPYCGPAVSDKKGNIKNTQPPESSPFWAAVTHWYQQGKVISDTGLCVWMTPPKPKLVRIGGKNYALEGSVLAEKYGAAGDKS
jgi:hypothetical protein